MSYLLFLQSCVKNQTVIDSLLSLNTASKIISWLSCMSSMNLQIKYIIWSLFIQAPQWRRGRRAEGLCHPPPLSPNFSQIVPCQEMFSWKFAFVSFSKASKTFLAPVLPESCWEPCDLYNNRYILFILEQETFCFVGYSFFRVVLKPCITR